MNSRTRRGLGACIKSGWMKKQEVGVPADQEARDRGQATRATKGRAGNTCQISAAGGCKDTLPTHWAEANISKSLKWRLGRGIAPLSPHCVPWLCYILERGITSGVTVHITPPRLVWCQGNQRRWAHFVHPRLQAASSG